MQADESLFRVEQYFSWTQPGIILQGYKAYLCLHRMLAIGFLPGRGLTWVYLSHNHAAIVNAPVLFCECDVLVHHDVQLLECYFFN